MKQLIKLTVIFLILELKDLKEDDTEEKDIRVPEDYI